MNAQPTQKHNKSPPVAFDRRAYRTSHLRARHRLLPLTLMHDSDMTATVIQASSALMTVAMQGISNPSGSPPTLRQPFNQVAAPTIQPSTNLQGCLSPYPATHQSPTDFDFLPHAILSEQQGNQILLFSSIKGGENKLSKAVDVRNFGTRVTVQGRLRNGNVGEYLCGVSMCKYV